MSGDGAIVVAGSIDFGLVGVFALRQYTWHMLGQEYLEEPSSEFGDFGGYQDCSADGSTFVVAFPGYGNNEGSVSIYRINHAKTDFTKLGTSIVGARPNQRMGMTVALSGDGTTVAITSDIPFDREPLPGPGAVTTYRFDGNSTWSQIGQTLEGAGNEEKGKTIALSDDGSHLLVGSPGYNAETGRAEMFRLVGNVWTKVGNDLVGEVPRARFGSVSMSGDASVLAVGAMTTAVGGSSGAIKVWEVVAT